MNVPTFPAGDCLHVSVLDAEKSSDYRGLDACSEQNLDRALNRKNESNHVDSISCLHDVFVDQKSKYPLT